jgi:hypothetical protein
MRFINGYIKLYFFIIRNFNTLLPIFGFSLGSVGGMIFVERRKYSSGSIALGDKFPSSSFNKSLESTLLHKYELQLISFLSNTVELGVGSNRLGYFGFFEKNFKHTTLSLFH